MDSTNFAEFSLEIGRIVETLMPDEQSKFVRKIALEALRRVVFKTPADTGRARSNWQTTLDAPADGIVEAFSPGKNLGKGETANAGAAIAAGSGVIAKAQPFGVIWISNNVGYIQSLENGNSKQSPEGMVAVTIAELQTKVES